MRAGATLDDAGDPVPTWFQTERGLVGEDGVIRVAGAASMVGLIESGEYLVAYAPPGESATIQGEIELGRPLSPDNAGFTAFVDYEVEVEVPVGSVSGDLSSTVSETELVRQRYRAAVEFTTSIPFTLGPLGFVADFLISNAIIKPILMEIANALTIVRFTE